ncbi:MAG: hypothetical protein QXX13_02755 [Candidatus Methanomethylicia archaeon]
MARRASIKCGCNYGRRMFIRGLIALTLTAIITQKIPLTWGKGESKHPLLKAKFLRSIELKGDGLNEAIKRMVRSKDVNNIVNPDQLDLNKAIAVKHIIEFSNEENTLLAIGTLTNGSEAIIYYELEKPIEWLKTEAILITYSKKASKYFVKAVSINGRIGKTNNNGESINPDYSEGPCIEECNNDWDCGGPPNACATYCCNGNDTCLGICCGACAILCVYGDLVECIVCVSIVLSMVFGSLLLL